MINKIALQSSSHRSNKNGLICPQTHERTHPVVGLHMTAGQDDMFCQSTEANRYLGRPHRCALLAGEHSVTAWLASGHTHWLNLLLTYWLTKITTGFTRGRSELFSLFIDLLGCFFLINQPIWCDLGLSTRSHQIGCYAETNSPKLLKQEHVVLQTFGDINNVFSPI